MSNWTQPQCEACWIRYHLTVLPDGDFVIAMPTRVKPADDDEGPVIAQCAWCAAVTISGIFVRANPDTLPFPTMPDDKEDDDQ